MINARILNAVCEQLAESSQADIKALALRVEELRSDLQSIPAGAPGVGIKSIAQAADLSSADIEFDNGTVIELQLPVGPRGDRGEPGPAGEPGDPGTAGADGQAPSADEVATVLLALPAFIAAATPAPLQAQAWHAGIHRAGTVVAHYIGRLYCAEQDTTAEPGESPDWRRLGTQGLRHVGGYSDTRLHEPGDLYAKNGSTFLFDGAEHRLLFAKPYTTAEADKHAKATAKDVEQLRAEVLSLSRALDDVVRRQMEPPQ